jgi:hypothetical protein
MQADIRFQEAAKQQWDLIVLPGGARGAETMRDSTELIAILAKQKADGKLVGASGATPSIVLASMPGFLQDGATCFPSMALRNTIPNASDNDVVVHDNIVTSQGIGSTLVFALMLVELLYDSELADTIARTMLIDRTKHQYFPPALDPKVRMGGHKKLDSLAIQQNNIAKPLMPCIMYMQKDAFFLSAHQNILRKQIEFFVANQEDIDKFPANRRKFICIGQVGIRCRYCAVIPDKKPIKGAMYFPASLYSIYQAGQNMLSLHFGDKCQYINPQLKAQLIELQRQNTGHGGKDYWAQAAVALGIEETERGLWFNGG